jgi:hypothetical protein
VRRAARPPTLGPMNAVPLEVAITTIVFYSAWVVGVLAVLVMGRRQDRLATQPPTIPPATGIDWSGWRRRLRSNLMPALILAMLYLLASLVLGRINPIAGGVFCQALVGLAIAYSIRGFEPLPVVKAIREHRQAVRAVVLMIVIGLVANVAAKVVGGLGLNAGSIFGEHDFTRQAASSFHVNAFQAVFVLLGGGGVAEELMFRLVAVSLEADGPCMDGCGGRFSAVRRVSLHAAGRPVPYVLAVPYRCFGIEPARRNRVGDRLREARSGDRGRRPHAARLVDVSSLCPLRLSHAAARTSERANAAACAGAD